MVTKPNEYAATVTKHPPTNMAPSRTTMEFVTRTTLASPPRWRRTLST